MSAQGIQRRSSTWILESKGKAKDFTGAHGGRLFSLTLWNKCCPIKELRRLFFAGVPPRSVFQQYGVHLWLEISINTGLRRTWRLLCWCCYFTIYDVIKRAEWTDTWNQMTAVHTLHIDVNMKDGLCFLVRPISGGALCKWYVLQPATGGRSRWFGKLSDHLLSSRELKHKPNGRDLFLSVRRAMTV